jgi:hypothetical protein
MTVQDLIDMAGGVGKLAKLCKVSHSSICDWSRNGTIPGHRVPRISKALNISADALMPLVSVPKCDACPEAA